MVMANLELPNSILSLGHIVNQHENDKDPLFIRCAHGGKIAQQKLLTKDYRQLHVEYVARLQGQIWLS